MLERYEQKMLIEYLLEGLSKFKKSQMTCEIQEKIDNLVDNINEYNENGSIGFYLQINDDINLAKRDLYARHLKNIVKQLKKEYEKVKNAKPSNRAKCFKIIQKLFDLTEEDTKVFALFVRNENSETFCSCLCLASDRFSRITAQNITFKK